MALRPRDGRDWALFKSGGSMPLLGPVFRAGAAPCWACLSRPMVENRPGDTVLAGGTVAARPARGSSPATRSLAVNFAAFELARAEVVPGDVVRLAAGDLVPADSRLLEAM